MRNSERTTTLQDSQANWKLLVFLILAFRMLTLKTICDDQESLWNIFPYFCIWFTHQKQLHALCLFQKPLFPFQSNSSACYRTSTIFAASWADEMTSTQKISELLVRHKNVLVSGRERITNYFCLTPTHAIFTPKAEIENFFQLLGCKVGFVDSAVFMSHLSSQTLNSHMHWYFTRKR